MMFRGVLAALLSVLGVAACSSGMNAAVQSLQHVLRGAPDVEAGKLDPQFAYLRVTRGRHVGLLWLGSTEKVEGDIVEVYYSSAGEVLRLLNGRLVGASGLTTEWRSVELVEAPRWSQVAQSPGPVPFTRIRDVMPGYRMGVRDELVSRSLETPPRNRLVGVDPAKLRWFEDTWQAAPGSRLMPAAVPSNTEMLPPSRYAVAIQGAAEVVVYAEQCLASDLCFTWQRWSQAMQAASTSGSRDKR